MRIAVLVSAIIGVTPKQWKAVTPKVTPIKWGMSSNLMIWFDTRKKPNTTWILGFRGITMHCDSVYWWPLCESNTVPTDSGLWRFPASLDYAFTITTITIALGGCRLVSTRSTSISTWSFARHCLVHCCRQVSPNLTPSHIQFPRIWHIYIWVRCSNQAWAKGP